MTKKHPTPPRTPLIRARFEDLAYLAKTGSSTEEAAERLGMSESSMIKCIERHQAWPLVERLRANERERFGETLGERRRALENKRRAGRKHGIAA